MSKKQADAAKQGEFDAMGQPIGTKRGEADPSALKIIEAASAMSSGQAPLDEDEDILTPLVAPPVAPVPSTVPGTPAIGSGMLEALKAEMAQNPETTRFATSCVCRLAKLVTRTHMSMCATTTEREPWTCPVAKRSIWDQASCNSWAPGATCTST